MNMPINFEESGGEFRAQVVVPFDAHPEYKKHIYEKLREELGIKLYGLIEQSKTPVTIDISEKIIDFPKFSRMYYSADIADKLEIRVRFTPVRYREVVIEKHYAEQFGMTKLDQFYAKVRKWVYRGKK